MNKLLPLALLVLICSFYAGAKDTDTSNHSFAKAEVLTVPFSDTAQILVAGKANYFKVDVTRSEVLILNLTNIPGLNVEMSVYSDTTADSLVGYSSYGGNRTLEVLLSPGIYYIKVDDHFNQTSSTDYILASSFDSNDPGECDNTFYEAYPIPDSTSFTAEIRGINDLRTPVTDVDYYKVHVDRYGVLVLALANIPGLNVEMTVYSAPNVDSLVGYSGYGGNRSLELLIAPGDYYILVDDHFNQTSATPYGLTVSFDTSDISEYDNSFYAAYPIPANTIFNAKIRGINDLRTPVIDVDYYKVHIDRCGALLLNLTNIPGLNIEMTVYAAPADTSIGYSGYGGNRSLQILVSPGDYYILVDDHFNQTSATPYTLQLTFDTSNACGCNYTLATACSIPDSTTFQNKIEGTLGNMVDVNYYKVNIDRCGVLVLNLTNIPGLNVEMTVYEGANIDSVVGYSGYGGNRSLELLVSAGEYYIKVDDHFNATSTTPYGLTLSFDSSDVGECDNSFYEAYTIPANTTFSAKIRGINDLRTPVTDVDYYKVHIDRCGALLLNLTNIPGLNIEMTVYAAPTDTSIGYSGYGGNRSLQILVSPGDYYILVDNHFNQTSATPYTLAVSFDTSNACGCNYTLATACSIPDSTTFQSKLEGTLGNFIDVNYYKVNIDRCGVLVLNLTNIPGLNVEMTVYEGANIDSVVGYSGYGGNRSLELLVSAGEYYIKVDDHFNATSSNPYGLTLSFDSSDVGECDNSFYEAYTIHDTGTFQAKIRGINDLRMPVIDVDYYKINIPLCGQLTINLTNIGGLNIEMTAYSAPNADSSIGYSGYGGNRSLTLTRRPGDIYLLVDDHFNSTSSQFYSLKMTFTPNPAIPVVTANGPLDFCTGGSVTLTSDSTVNSFWSTGATGKSITVTQSGIYVDTIKLSNGCASPSKPIAIEADALPQVPVISSSGATTFCNGLSTTLSSSAATNNYWSTGSNSQNINVTSTGIFSDTVKSNPGCYVVSDTIGVTVNPVPPVPTITPAGTVAVCQSKSDTLVSSSLTGNHWSNGETTTSIIISNANVYTDTVTNSFGCSAISAPDTVTISPLPTAGFTEVNNNRTYTFTNTSVNGTSYLWEFGDGGTSNSRNPVHIYLGNGTEKITLITSNNCGSDTTSETINIATGIAELNAAAHLTITPDPCYQCELIGSVNTKDLIITDILGRTCAADYTKTANGYYISMYGYSSGVFLIRDMRTGEVVKFVKE